MIWILMILGWGDLSSLGEPALAFRTSVGCEAVLHRVVLTDPRVRLRCVSVDLMSEAR